MGIWKEKETGRGGIGEMNTWQGLLSGRMDESEINPNNKKKGGEV